MKTASNVEKTSVPSVPSVSVPLGEKSGLPLFPVPEGFSPSVRGSELLDRLYGLNVAEIVELYNLVTGENRKGFPSKKFGLFELTEVLENGPEEEEEKPVNVKVRTRTLDRSRSVAKALKELRKNGKKIYYYKELSAKANELYVKAGKGDSITESTWYVNRVLPALEELGYVSLSPSAKSFTFPTPVTKEEKPEVKEEKPEVKIRKKK